MIATLRVYFLLSVLVMSVNFGYTILRLPGQITFAVAFMLWMAAGLSRVFGRRPSAPSMQQALRGIVMALVWPLVCKRS